MTRTVVLAATRSVAGGAQRALAALASGLSDRGWRVEAMLAEPGWLVADLVRRGIAVDVGDPPRLDAARHDVVVSLGASGHAWAGPVAAAAGVPACWWLELGLRDRPVERRAATIPAAATAAPTSVAARALRELLPSVPVEVIAPGVEVGDVAAHHTSGLGLRARISADHLLVLVGRIDPIKGHEVALDALARLRDEGRSIHLAVVGGAIVGHEGDLEARLHARAHHLRLIDHVTWTGHLDDPGSWHAAADVAVHASRHEAFGLAIVEALAHAAPVVATATDGPREILADGAHGLLVPPGDPRALAEAVGRVLDDEELAAQLASSGPRRAADFSVEVAAGSWDRLLRGVRRGGCGLGG